VGLGGFAQVVALSLASKLLSSGRASTTTSSKAKEGGHSSSPKGARVIGSHPTASVASQQKGAAGLKGGEGSGLGLGLVEYCLRRGALRVLGRVCEANPGNGLVMDAVKKVLALLQRAEG
jgi:hypothetical protein